MSPVTVGRFERGSDSSPCDRIKNAFKASLENSFGDSMTIGRKLEAVISEKELL